MLTCQGDDQGGGEIGGELDGSIGDETGIGELPPGDESGATSGAASGATAISADRQDVLGRLTVSDPDKVTYAQIEQAMAEAGLDPAVHEDDYIWLMERL